MTVTLYDTSGTEIAQTVTDSAGNYVFFDLLAGNYVVVESNLPGYIDVFDVFGNPLDNIVNVTLTGGENKTDQDFVDRLVGSISGSVKEDLNNDDVGDADLSGVTLTLVDSAGTVIATTVTDSAGKFTFDDIPVGNYTVVERNPPDYVDVSDNGGNPLDNRIPVVLDGSGNITGLLFVDERLGSIAGSVKEDVDNDDTGDVDLSGVTITLLDSAGDEVSSTVTDSNGAFLFVNLPAGNYTVVEDNLPRYTDVSDNGGNPLDDRIPVALASGANATGLLYVDERLGSIGGSVKEDVDNDDTGDVDLSGVTITLLDSAGAVIATTVTGPSGSFLFVNLPAGNYTVVETNLAGYTDVSDNGGNPLDDRIPVSLGSGVNATGLLFVDERVGSISGNVTEDLDNNDTGDVALSGVNVTLLNGNGNIIASTLTDSNGMFMFSGLPAGNYTVVEENLPIYLDVSDVEGNPTDNVIHVILGPGMIVTDRNFVDEFPTPSPTHSPTLMPTSAPTLMPTKQPTSMPSSMPSACKLLPNDIDICLLIDGSESIKQSQYALSLKFTRDLVNSVYAISPRSLYSVVFIDNVLVIGATNQNANATIPKLTNTTHPKRGTETVKGFNACQATFPADGKPHLIILLTDGDPNGIGSEEEALADATAAATAAKATGTTIASIGVGALIATENLAAWATNPDFVFTARDFTILQNITSSIISQITCA